MPSQLVLPFGSQPALKREDFIVAPCNEQALTFIERWPDWPARAAAIWGPPDSGKTHLARLIHDCSARRTNRFLPVACGTLSGNLIASEFFGHVKGAFTGADMTKVGKFAAAGQGTILLDEIDTLGLEHQANLLRVIETGEYEPVGSTETQTC